MVTLKQIEDDSDLLGSEAVALFAMLTAFDLDGYGGVVKYTGEDGLLLQKIFFAFFHSKMKCQLLLPKVPAAVQTNHPYQKRVNAGIHC